VIKDGLTAKACMELVGFEAIVLEAYKDVKGIWTWAIGITSASGHKVERYIDNPQTVKFCLQIFIWLLRTKYLPDVLRVFRGTELSEAQLAAALSFHYNTGAIGHATWVDHWKAGDIAGAKVLFMHWDKPASIIERRQKECDLFFDGKWSSDELGLVLPVLKPSYHPNFHGAYHVAIKTALEDLLGAG
jgi:GH24 family phage-related lysozyme (muramidase)